MMVEVFFLFTSINSRSPLRGSFGTPTALEFHDIAHMYNMDYIRVDTISELSEKFSSDKKWSLRLIEIFTDRAENVQAHRALWNRINAEFKA